MATWKLSPQYKKSAVERQYWYKDGKTIIREEGYRWGTFSVESDERPLSDAELKNEDGYELSCIDNDECWELWDLTDGCWADTEAGRDCTEEDLEEFNTAWDEDTYEAVEALGWMCDDTEYYYYGPLELTNQDTGEVFQGEPDENISVGGVPIAPVEVMEEALEEMTIDEPEVTDWFPVSVNPVRNGTYQITSNVSPNWPFPTYAQWDGTQWTDEHVAQWRGLVKESK
jgi:hypothetical protein